MGFPSYVVISQYQRFFFNFVLLHLIVHICLSRNLYSLLSNETTVSVLNLAG
jgi:hypothetical protein